jgi:hypothetical protein
LEGGHESLQSENELVGAAKRAGDAVVDVLEFVARGERRHGLNGIELQHHRVRLDRAATIARRDRSARE